MLSLGSTHGAGPPYPEEKSWLSWGFKNPFGSWLFYLKIGKNLISYSFWEEDDTNDDKKNWKIEKIKLKFKKNQMKMI